jgi:hypothetical protein
MRNLRVDPSRAREDAAEILQDRRFHRDPAPRPLRGPLEWLGDRLRSVSDAVRDALQVLPGPTWLALASIALLAALALVFWLVRVHRRGGRRRGVAGAGADALVATTPADPKALERAADEAEAAGDLERALRLRFRAGLLRLDQRGAIRYQPSLTTSEVRRRLGSATFDELASRFEEVAYGLDAARPADVDAARAGWPRVVEDATRQ